MKRATIDLSLTHAKVNMKTTKTLKFWVEFIYLAPHHIHRLKWPHSALIMKRKTCLQPWSLQRICHQNPIKIRTSIKRKKNIETKRWKKLEGFRRRNPFQLLHYRSFEWCGFHFSKNVINARNLFGGQALYSVNRHLLCQNNILFHATQMLSLMIVVKSVSFLNHSLDNTEKPSIPS